ncbi:MAG: DUF4339 domain-containing protein [Gemmataceae bacterium]|nr:DUF4339 domain-containing protein [Gemmataceae bacterium]
MASVKVTCPACKASLQVGPDLLGKAIKCPKCKKPFKSPATATASPAKPIAAPDKPTIEPDKYVVARGAKKFGPYTMSQLKQLVELGKLNPDDQLRKGTAGDWESASDLPGLFPETESGLDADEEEDLFGGVEDEAPAPVIAKASVRKPVIAEDDEETIAEDEEEETPASRGKDKKPVRVAADDDEEEEEDAKPVKKKKGGGLLLVLLLLLIIGGGGGAAWWFFLGGQEMFNPQPIGKINTPLADSTKKGSPVETPKSDDGNKDKDNGHKDDAKKEDGKKDDGKIEEKKEPENPPVAGSNDVEMKYLSDAIQGVAVVNVQRLLRSPLAKEFDAMSLIRGKVPAIDPAKVERLVFYAEPVPAGKFPASFGFVVRMSEPIDPKIFPENKAEETTFEGKKAWKVAEEGLDIYVLQHDDKTYVGGVEGTLKKMLAGGDASPLRTKFGMMDPNSADVLLVGVLDSPNQEALPLRKTLIAMAKDLPEPFKKLEDVAPKLTAVSLTLDLSGSNLLAAAFDLADEQAAESLKSVGTDGVNFVKTFLRPVAAKMVAEKSPPDLKKLATAVMDDVFNGMSVAQQEKSVTASIRNPKSLPELIKQAAPMIQKLFGDKKEAAPADPKVLESRLPNEDAGRQAICLVALPKVAGRTAIGFRQDRDEWAA